MRMLTLSKAMSDEAAEALGGTMLDESSYDHLITDDADVYTDTGTLLIAFRRGAVPLEECRAAYQNLRTAPEESDNRGMAAGVITHPLQLKERPGKITRTRYKTLKEDGSLSKTNRAITVKSGIVGYFDRNARYPYCRLTAFNLADNGERFAAALPFIRCIDRVFAAAVPDRYTAQQAIVQATSPDFYIPETVFTTITVNKNWQTAVHKDVGDYKPGFGVMSALRAGRFTGCYLCWPQYRVAVDMQTSDVCMADVHEWHGNTPLSGTRGRYERISCVFYYRESMVDCGSATEELERAKRRKPGDKLRGKAPPLEESAA
jgi:2-oxoglutarate-Fe(II)-dependent dioxygenase family protein